MKTTITKKIIALALSVFSMAALAQCPSITGFTTIYGPGGTATVTPIWSSTITPVVIYNWSATWGSPIITSTGPQWGCTFSANGGYSVCVNVVDSTGACPTQNYCSSVVISNAGSGCNANFGAFMDSSCATHFVNGSIGSNLTYYWLINGTSYNSSDPIVNLPNGNYNVTLYTYSSGAFCDSIMQPVVINCAGTSTSNACQANFTSFTDSNCVTYFINNSTGTNLTYDWSINGNTYNSTNPSVSLPNGNYPAYLITYSNGVFCDSTYQYVNINCISGGTNTPAGCQANSQFYIFPDSVNAGNYFAYNLSTGTGVVSYLWDFGDGTTSTQLYPIHQYAVPGQYVVCLTTTATSGTTTCSDTYCDSSSVHRVSSGFLMSHINIIPLSVTGIKQTEKEIGLKAFPNPMADEITIEATTANDAKLTYVLVDALGRTVITGNLNNSKTTINTSNLEKGFYSLSVTNEKGSSLKTIKLVK